MTIPFLKYGPAVAALFASASALAAELGPLAPALQPSLDHHAVCGAVALVANKDKVLDLESVGVSSVSTQQPMANDDLFWIASMTKSVTGTAFMMLVDEGKVSLDDPVEKYLPEFKSQQVVGNGDSLELHPPRHPITVKEVLTHTSGLILAGDKSLKPTNTLKGDVAQCAAAPLRQEPGTKFEYNNSGINTAGRIIEVISGMPYADFIQQRLLTPLGMKNTTFWPNAEQAKHLASSVKFTQDKTALEDIAFAKDITPALIEKLGHGVQVPMEVLSNFGHGKITEYADHYADAAGGLFSTAEDMGIFCQMLLNRGVWQGKRYLSENALAQMSSIQTGDVLVNPQEGYGQGWFVKKKEDEGLSTGSFGHRGARRTIMWVDPAHQLAMVLLVQRMDMTGDQQKELYTSFMKTAVEKFGSHPIAP